MNWSDTPIPADVAVAIAILAFFAGCAAGTHIERAAQKLRGDR